MSTLHLVVAQIFDLLRPFDLFLRLFLGCNLRKLGPARGLDYGGDDLRRQSHPVDELVDVHRPMDAEHAAEALQGEAEPDLHGRLPSKDLRFGAHGIAPVTPDDPAVSFAPCRGDREMSCTRGEYRRTMSSVPSTDPSDATTICSLSAG
jgi:hypothetical protein